MGVVVVVVVVVVFMVCSTESMQFLVRNVDNSFRAFMKDRRIKSKCDEGMTLSLAIHLLY